MSVGTTTDRAARITTARMSSENAASKAAIAAGSRAAQGTREIEVSEVGPCTAERVEVPCERLLGYLDGGPGGPARLPSCADLLVDHALPQRRRAYYIRRGHARRRDHAEGRGPLRRVSGLPPCRWRSRHGEPEPAIGHRHGRGDRCTAPGDAPARGGERARALRRSRARRRGRLGRRLRRVRSRARSRGRGEARTCGQDRPRPRHRRGASLAFVVAVGIVGAREQRARAASRVSRGAEARWARVWDAPAKEAIRSAFVATGAPKAEDTWRSLEQTIDVYAGEWVSARTDGRVRGNERAPGAVGCDARRADGVPR